MTTAASGTMFKRCNVSEDIMKRFSNKDSLDTIPIPGHRAGVSRKPISLSSSPPGKTAALERLLLSVPLSVDVASFSDTDNLNTPRKIPLYSDDHNSLTVCLPSSGYKSAPEGSEYTIRTTKINNLKAKNTLINSGVKSNVLRRTNSLRSKPVTNRINVLQEKLNKTKEVKTDGEDTEDSKNNIRRTSKSSLGPLQKSNSLTNLNTINYSSKTRNARTLNQKTDNESIQQTGKGRPNRFNSLHDAWEQRKSDDANQPVDKSDSSKPKTNSHNEEDTCYQRKRRDSRLKREAFLKSFEKSDSETEPEDGQLTHAGLERLDRRNKHAALRGRRGRIDSNKSGGMHDENNNETASDKTLDSGVFDMYLTNISEDINKLSKRYDSKEFLLDDSLSLKSGYSSASESLADSIADSITTTYDSNEEQQQWDVNKTKAGYTKHKPKSSITGINKFNASNVTNHINKLTKNNLKSHTNILNKSTPGASILSINSESITSKNITSVNPAYPQEIKTSVGISQIANISDIAVKKIDDMKETNKVSNGDKKLVDMSGCQVNASTNSFDKHTTNPPIVIQLTSDGLKECSRQLDSNSSTNLKISNEAERTIELDNLKDNMNKRTNSSIVNPTSRNSDETINTLNKAVTESNKRDLINVTSAIQNHDKNKNTNSGSYLRSKNGYRITAGDEHDGKTTQKTWNTHILKPASVDDVSNKQTLANNPLINRTRNVNRRRESTELSILPQAKPLFSATDSSLLPGNKTLFGQLKKYKTESSQSDGEYISQIKPVKNVLINRTKSVNSSRRGSTELSLLPGNEKQPADKATNPLLNGTKNLFHRTGATGLKISPSNKLVLTTNISLPSGNALSPEEPVTDKTESRTPISLEVEKIIVECLDKGVQCILLSDIIIPSETIVEKPVLVEPNIHTDTLHELGQEILQDIQFKYPENFIPSPTSDVKVMVDSDHLKIDNARLQNLLFEVERARSGTIKALLHVNTLLNKVQGDNAQLKSDIEVCSQEKATLMENLKDIKEKGQPKQTNSAVAWRREKMELLTQLDKSSKQAEDAGKELVKLRAKYKKVKDQLEHSNNAFTTTLKNNLDAAKRMELELKGCMEEKQDLLSRCDEGNKLKRELDALKQEMEELRFSHEELQDEKDQLVQKIVHLEKKRKQLQIEEEELHEQISHSQEIIESLSEAEEGLKSRLEKEEREKEFLQECLDETGQILYQLKSNEKRLVEDKNVLQYELEAESEERESLATTLSKTKSEQEDLIDRLQNMTNIHINVKESLQLANKKEKNYQEQIEALTKRSHILQYTLEKEKEEHLELQEMLEIINLHYRSLKDATVGEGRETEIKLEKLTNENMKLVEINDKLVGISDELKADMEKEEERRTELHEKIAELEKVKGEAENSLCTMREHEIEINKSMKQSLQQRHVLDENLKSEREKIVRLVKSLEKKKKTLEKVESELLEAKKRLEHYKGNYDDLEERRKGCKATLREMEDKIKELTLLRDKYFNRMTYYETETKQLRKNVNDQTDELGTLQVGTQRLTRERDKLKRNLETSEQGFEAHKLKCCEAIKRLKNDIIELSSKIVEKRRIGMKQNDHLDNSKSDLEVLRRILDTEGLSTDDSINNTDMTKEKLNLQFLRETHDKYRVEFQSHVEKLEDMLHESKACNDSITVVQSPMSKIKLEELKLLRNETFDLHSDVASVKRKVENLKVDLFNKLGLPNNNSHNNSADESSIKSHLSKLNDLMTKLEHRHLAVVNQNSILLENTLICDDSTSKDLVKKFQLVSLQGENRQLKAFVGLLQKKYNFSEENVSEELKLISEGDKISMSELCSLANKISNGSKDGSYSGSESVFEKQSTSSANESSLNEQYISSQTRRNKNYNFFNNILSPSKLSSRNYSPSSPNITSSSRSYSRGNRSACSTPPTYFSEDEDLMRFPRRYHTLPSRRRRRPKSSYS